MKVFYDTEFIEDGRTISLVSIGMVADDGRKLYLINREAPLDRLAVHDWLMANVVPWLPLARDERGLLSWNTMHPDWETVTTHSNIARLVRRFLEETPGAELWANYGAYDHVALAQLFGKMSALPDCVPMWTNDVMQEAARLGNPDLPAQRDGEHNALADASHVKALYEHLQALAVQGA